jgi:hypothetical protein
MGAAAILASVERSPPPIRIDVAIIRDPSSIDPGSEAG